MSIPQKYLNAIETLKEKCTYGKMKYKLAAGLVVGKTLLKNIASVNSDRTIVHGKIEPSFHAEHAAIVNGCNQRIKMKNATLVVVRIDNFGNLASSKPCFLLR